MKTLLIVFHTMTDGARQMAVAAARGASREPAVHTRMLPARETAAEDVLEASGYIFVTPENLASMSGMMKDFFDRTYYAALDRIAGRAYITLICAGSDGENAVRQIDRICTGWRLRKTAEPVIVCTHAQTPEQILARKIIPPQSLQRCEDAGAALATGMALGVF